MLALIIWRWNVAASLGRLISGATKHRAISTRQTLASSLNKIISNINGGEQLRAGNCVTSADREENEGKKCKPYTLLFGTLGRTWSSAALELEYI